MKWKSVSTERLQTRLCRGVWRVCVFCALACGVTAPAAKPLNSVYISEFLAENRHGLENTDGTRSGWIELYNGTSEEVNLAGWFLSDTPTNLTRWRFPGVGILSGTYLVVFASGKANISDLAHLETNFRLSTNGGYLALIDPSTNIVSDCSPGYRGQSPDTSYGRVVGEPDIWGYFSEPTPGKRNQSSGPGFAPKVSFSATGGSFVEPFGLSLSCDSTKALIRYSLDGRLPSRTSPVYSSPIWITNTVCVRARAYQDGLLPGPPCSATYLLVSTNLLKFNSDLAVLVMDTLASSRATSARSSEVHLAFFEPVGGKTSLANPPTMTTRGGFHMRGSTSAQMPQAGFALQFLDEFNHEQHVSPLGLPANSDWVLYAPTSYDPIMIHNPFVHQLSRDMGRYSPRTRFLEVFLARHGGPITLRDYHGIYVLEEKIKVGKHRVAIDRLAPEDLKEPEVSGGYLLKFDRLGPGESGLWAGGAELVYVEPKEPVISLPQRAPQREYIRAYLDEFNGVLHSPGWKDPASGYRAYIDVDSWIDFHVLEVLSGNVDALKFSTHFYKPRGGKLTFGPHWDFDRALGSTDWRDAEPRRWNTGRFFDAPWWGRLFRDPDFWQLWVDRWQALRQTHFSNTNLFELIDRLTGELRTAQPRQAQRWGLEPRGGTYQSEVDWMKNWLAERTDFIDGQLVQPPRLGSPGGQVQSGYELSLDSPSQSTIYYTMDGSDPRLPQGAISSAALVYSGAIPIKGEARIVARARNPDKRQTGGPPISTPWSGPVKASFTVVPR